MDIATRFIDRFLPRLRPCPDAIGRPPEQQYEMGIAFLYASPNADFVKAEYCLEQAARRGYVPAMRQLGILYAEGHPGRRNYRRAHELLNKAAEAGDNAAKLHLGRMLLDGRGVTPDIDTGEYWLLDAARENDRDALLELGKRCRNGRMGAHGPEDAAYYFSLAAEQNSPEANYQLGELADTPEAACRFYRKAANARHAGAMARLGAAMLSGNGLPRNEEEGIRLLTAAAEQGNHDAQFQLGTHLGATDPVRGAMWLTIATTFGSDEAEKALQKLTSQMDAEAVENSADLVCCWFRDIIEQDYAR